MSEQVRETVEVPGYSGRSVHVRAGESVRITDIEGAQVGDMFAVSVADHTEFLSAAITRQVLHTLFPSPGDPFYSTKHRPMLTFVADHSPGFHDMLFAPCDDALYQSRGMHDHPNCRDNYLACAETEDLAHRVVPEPVNVFQNTPVQADGRLELRTTATAAGDHIVVRAEMDLILILTACSSERINDGKSTPMRIEVLAGSS